MPFATQLQSFQGSNTYQNSIASNCIPLWASNQVYITGGQGGWTTMAFVNVIGGGEVDYSDLSLLNNPTLNVSIGTGYPWGIDPDGLLYCRSGLGMSQVNPNGWTRDATWGDVTYGLFPPPLPDSTGSNDALGGQIIVIKNSNGTKYWISGGVGGFGFHGNDVFLQSGSDFAGLFFGGYDPGNTNGCNGPNGAGYGYYTTHTTSGASPALVYKIVCNDGSWVPADWPTTNTSIIKTTIASIAPTDIDATWGNIQIMGVCIDTSDNNLLVFFAGDVGPNERYLTKINSSSGAIIWSTAADSNLNPGAHMRFSRVNGRMYFVVAGHIYGYDTSDGSLIIDQTTGLENLFVYGPQMFDDETGVIIGLFSLSSIGSDSPTILNTTPSFIDGSVAWMALYVASPPPAPQLGSAYFIERMDNRIWPAVENVWCVDCGLSTTLTYPDSRLVASSATGAGIPTSAAITSGGQGYSAATTAEIQDPTGSGAVVSLTIASGIITAVLITGGTGYTYPVLVFNDPSGNGMGADIAVTLDTSMTFIADDPVFDSGMVGYALRMGGGRAIITAFIDTETVTADIVNPIISTIPNSGGVPLPAPSGEWSIAPMITTVGGLWHLIGFTVTGTADGAVIDPQEVSVDGTITLGTPASLVTVGLAFTPQFQSLYLDGGSPTVQGQRKKVGAVTIRLDASGVNGIVGGSNQPDGAAQNPPVIDMTWQGLVPFELRSDEGIPPFGSTTAPLWTGDVRQPIAGGFDRPGQVALQQNNPLPMNVLAIVPEGLEGDTPQQGYEQSPGRPPGRGNRG